MVKDEGKTLKELKVVKNSKMMLVGTTMSDLVAVTTKPSTAEIAASSNTTVTKEPLCKQKVFTFSNLSHFKLENTSKMDLWQWNARL